MTTSLNSLDAYLDASDNVISNNTLSSEMITSQSQKLEWAYLEIVSIKHAHILLLCLQFNTNNKYTIYIGCCIQ